MRSCLLKYRTNKGHVYLDRTDPLLKSFLKELSRKPVLSPDKQVPFILEAQAGNMKARKKVGECNCRLIVRIAKKYQSKAVSINDLIQEGYIGLNEAIDNFNPDKEVPFPHYAAWWIRVHITRYLEWHKNSVRLPESQLRAFHKLMKISTHFVASNFCKPSMEELMELSGFTKEKVQLFLEMYQLNQQGEYAGCEDYDKLNVVLHDSSPSPEEVTDKNIVTEAIAQCLDTLSEKHQEFLRDYYGIGRPAVSVTELSRRTKTTTENIRQMRVRLIKYLQNNCSEDLAPYYD